MKKKILTVLAFSLCLTFFSGIDTNILKAEENTTEVEENQDNSNKNDEGTEVLPLDESQTENDTISEENDVTSKETNDTKSSEPIYEEGYYTVGDNGEIEYIDLTPPTEEDDNVNQKNLARSTELGLLKLRTKGSASYITSYSDINGKSGYLNGYYAGDAAYLGNVTGGVKFKVAGTIGTMAPTENHNGVVKNNYKIVPLSNVKSASYYYVSNGLLYHRVAADIEVVDSYLNTTGTPIGVAPSYLSTGTKYYSYDGHYFYTTLQQMINDYKGNIYANSVNPNNVYYSYYQYLNTRSKTTLTASELNAAVRRHTSSGVMLDKSSSFISAQNTNGVNALLATAHAALESNWGRSDMAVSKNNIFGINAGDLDPSGANKFPSVEKCIAAYSEMISIDFCDPKDGLGRYFGGHYGDKASGINVKYASDPYLGEKVGSIALSLDSSRKDLDYYQLAVNEGNNLVAVRKDASQSATSLYTNSNIRSYPVIVLQKNGSFQQIQSDAVLKSDRSGILQDVATYNFSYMYGYVDSSTFKDINVGKNEINTGIKIDSTEILDSDATGFTVKVTTSGGNGLKRVRIPVWTDKNWQDDLVWYEGVVNGNVATCRVELKNHNYEEGLYHVHAYAYDNDDKKFIYNTTTNVTKPKFQIDSTEILDSDATGFTVKVTTSNGNGLKRVRIPVWTDKNGQDDLVWYEGIVVGNTATYRVDVKNHNYEDGLYHVHAYAYDNDDKKFIYNTTTTVKIPPLKIDSTEILDSDETGFTVKVTTSGGSGLTRVRIPVWTDKNWQDDLVWYEGVVKGNTATYRVNVKNHNYEEGLYHVHAYAYDKGNRKFIYNTTTNVTIPKFQIDSTEILDSDATGFTVKVTTSNGNGLKRVRIPVWTDKNWQDDLVWY
ncbi:GBS Bsp-like repeat-containing protein, partial [Breznakia sp. PM6-1]|uniref:GBS Bsp-like repeat-containing protein n=1 Tax=Breznakia sp. PM6-1 TaxID=2940628 RepID=UPI002405CB8D